MVKKAFIVALFSFLTGLACAQDFYHRPGFLAGRSLLTLSLFGEVQSELKAPSEFNGKAEDLVKKMAGEAQDAFQGGDFAAARPLIEKITNKYDDEVQKLLTADQVTRLKQLFVQYNGNNAISQGAIEVDLAITDDQKKQIAKAQDDNFKQVMDLFQSGGSPEDNRGAMDKLRTQLGDALDKILTDDQRTKFKGMSGTKFEFKKVDG